MLAQLLHVILAGPAGFTHGEDEDHRRLGGALQELHQQGLVGHAAVGVAAVVDGEFNKHDVRTVGQNILLAAGHAQERRRAGDACIMIPEHGGVGHELLREDLRGAVGIAVGLPGGGFAALGDGAAQIYDGDFLAVLRLVNGAVEALSVAGGKVGALDHLLREQGVLRTGGQEGHKQRTGQNQGKQTDQMHERSLLSIYRSV